MAYLTPKVNRLVKTGLCVLAMFSAGLNLGLVSPALPDLQYLTGSSTSQISNILVWSGIGCAVGSLGGGPLFDKFNGYVCLSISTVLQGLFFAAVPFCPDIIGVTTLFTLGGVPNYGIFSGVFALTIKNWRDFPNLISPFIQLMDLMHAFGLAITPIVVEPFLGDFRNISLLNTTIPKTGDGVGDNVSNTTTSIFPGLGYNIHTACLIIGAFDIVIAAICLVGIGLRESTESRSSHHEHTEHCDDDETAPLLKEKQQVNKETSGDYHTIERRMPDDRQADVPKPSPALKRILKVDRRGSLPADRLPTDAADRRGSMPTDGGRGSSTTKRRSIASSIMRRVSMDGGIPLPEMDEYTHHRKQYKMHKTMFRAYLVIGFLFFVVNGGRDITMAGLLYAYVTTYLNFSTASGALLVTVYHMIRTFGHLVVILLARWVRPLWVGVADVFFLVVAAGALMATYDLSSMSIWVCSCVTAFATCNIYPTSLSIVEDTMPVTAKISGLLFCGMALGQMLFSLLAGNLLEKAGSVGVPITLLASALGCLILFVPLIIIGKKLKLPENNVISEQVIDSGDIPDERPRVVKFQGKEVM